MIAYPSEVILGPTLFDIPIEELFFFVIQTYIVSGHPDDSVRIGLLIPSADNMSPNHLHQASRDRRLFAQ